MSDFFTHLAARARGATNVVRPRLPSRFETPDSQPARVADAPLETVVELETPEIAPARAAAAPRAGGDDAPPTVTRAATEPHAPDPPIARAAVAAEPIRPPSRGVTPREDTAAPLAAPAAAAPAAVVPRAERPAAARAEPPVAAHAEAPRDHVVEPRVRREPAAFAPDAGAAPRREAARERAGAQPQQSAVSSTVRAATKIVPGAARLTAPLPPAIVPRVVRAVPERAPQPAAPPTTETTVHVSIGRIEVRATPPPAERRRDAAPPAVMSLGEYLSSRAERAR